MILRSYILALLLALTSRASFPSPCVLPPPGLEQLPALPPLADPLPEGGLCNRLADTLLTAAHLLDRATSDLGRAEVLGNLARRLQAYGFLDQARPAYLAAWQVDPAGFRPPFMLALIEHSQGHHDQALVYAEAAGELAPDHASLLALIAHLRFLAGRWDAADDAAQRAVALDPGLSHAHWTLAEIAARGDDPDAVLRHAAAALAGAPEADRLHALRSEALARLGRVDEAAVAARAAGPRAPDLSGPWIDTVRRLAFEPQSYARLGFGALRRGQWTAAAAAFDRALEEDPANAEILLAQGRTQRLLGEPAAAVDFLRRSVAVDDRYEPWVELGRALQAADAPAAAVDAYRRALVHRPQDKMARFWMAECLDREGDLEAALDLLETLIAEGFGPSGPLLAADIAVRSRQPERARRLLEQSMRRFPADASLARALEKLPPPSREGTGRDGSGSP